MERTDATLKQKLITLFQETGPAHHRAFKATDGADPEWPLWYADHMFESVQALMNAPVTKSKLVQMLVSAAEQQEAHPTGVDWPEAYADYFMRNYP